MFVCLVGLLAGSPFCLMVTLGRRCGGEGWQYRSTFCLTGTHVVSPLFAVETLNYEVLGG